VRLEAGELESGRDAMVLASSLCFGLAHSGPGVLFSCCSEGLHIHIPSPIVMGLEKLSS
jgi:hypothetical protein